MRKAVTLLEMILVLVIVGILLSVGSTLFRPNHLRDDARFVALKIRQAQYRGIGYDHRTFDGGVIDNKIGCLTLSKEELEENATQGEGTYKLHSSLSGELEGKKLCFDQAGRPALGGYSPLLKESKVLQIQNNGHEINITIFPYTGYVTIAY